MLTKINLNDINVELIKQYLRIDEDFNDDDVELQLYLNASLEYLYKYTNLEFEELNNSSNAVICTLMLIAHFYENKSIIATQQKLDLIFKSLMDIDRRWL